MTKYCTKCERSHSSKYKLCAQCRKYSREKVASTKEYLIKLGKCISCRKDNPTSNTRCDPCRLKQNTTQRLRKWNKAS